MLPENYEQILSEGGAIVENGFFANAEQLRIDAENYEACMQAMDKLGVPRYAEGGAEYSIFGRACWMGRSGRFK